MTASTNTTVYGLSPSRKVERNFTLKDNKVTGMKYPLDKSPGNGYFSKSSDVEVIKSSLRSLIRTSRGERFMLPEYGCDVKKFLMEPLDRQLFMEIKDEVLYSIRRYLQSVFVNKIQVFEAKDMTLRISLYCAYKDLDIQYFKTGVKV